jgi:hypothetical protein
MKPVAIRFSGHEGLDLSLHHNYNFFLKYFELRGPYTIYNYNELRRMVQRCKQ